MLFPRKARKACEGLLRMADHQSVNQASFSSCACAGIAGSAAGEANVGNQALLFVWHAWQLQSNYTLCILYLISCRIVSCSIMSCSEVVVKSRCIERTANRSFPLRISLAISASSRANVIWRERKI